jgi:hypothetical protein
VDFISLCKRGKNRLRAIYKADGTCELPALMKMDDEQGELLSVVYAADHEDMDGEFTTKDEIKKAAYGYAAAGSQLDVMHNGKALPKDRAYVAEQFLVHKSDTRFHNWKDRDGKLVDLEGAWATVTKINDPTLRRLYKEGDWDGVSLGGFADVEQEKALTADSLEEGLRRLLFPNHNKNKDSDMEPKDVEAAVNKAVEPLTKSIGDLVTALTPKKEEEKKVDDKDKKKEDDKPKAPVFKGDPTDEKALKAFKRDLQKFEVQAAADMATVDGITAFSEKMTELKKAWAEEDKKVEKSDDDSDEEEETEKKVKKSNQADDEDGDEKKTKVATLSKKDNGLMNAGRELFKKPKKQEA